MTQLHVPGPVDNIQNPAIVVPTQGIVAPNAVAGNGAVAHNPYGALGLSTPVLGGLPKRLVISLAGFEKTGKTHLAFTGKSPIVIFNLDLGTEGVIEKSQAAGKEIYVYDVPVERPTGLIASPDGASQDLSLIHI